MISSLKTYWEQNPLDKSDVQIVDGLFYEEEGGALKLLLPSAEEADFSELKQKIIYECHAAPYSGHLGIKNNPHLGQKEL